jgi:hypothetical protein
MMVSCSIIYVRLFSARRGILEDEANTNAEASEVRLGISKMLGE